MGLSKPCQWYRRRVASIRSRQRADGTWAHAVLYTHNKQQTSVTFDSKPEAEKFKESVNTIGPERAMKAWNIAPTVSAARRSTAPTVSDWLERYIASRTGIAKSTLYDYKSYLRNDIAPSIGTIPLDLLSRDDITTWVQELEERDLAAKTIANRHGFLSAALNVAVEDELIPTNPAAATRLPRGEATEMVFLDHDEFELFRECFTERWRPLLDFMVASGARFGEIAALVPADVDRKRGTVHIGKARKRTYDQVRYEIGPTKTRRSNRTLNIDRSILESLDYSQATLFTNTVGKPLEASSFRNNVWYPAREKAEAAGLAKRPRIHDMRHTCVSWMIADGQPLPVIQKHLGHESIKTTVDKYGHLDRKSAEQAAAVFAKVFGRRNEKTAPQSED